MRESRVELMNPEEVPAVGCGDRDQAIELLLPWDMLECEVSGWLEWPGQSWNLQQELSVSIFQFSLSDSKRKLLVEPSCTWCCYRLWFL